MAIQYITPSIISSIANTQITGTITASQIAAVNANTITSGTIPVAQIPQLTGAKLPAGTVLQVKQAVLTSTQAVSGSSAWTDITNLSVSITPTSSSSKILVMIALNVDGRNNLFFRIVRDSTAVGVGDASGSVSRVTMGNGYVGTWSGNGNQTMQLSSQYLDSPATTSATTYKVQGYVDNGSQTGSYYVNYSGSESNHAAAGRSISTITVMEVAV